MLAQGNLPRRYWVHWQEVHWIFQIFLGGKFIPYGTLNLKTLISVFGLYIFKLHNEPCWYSWVVGWISHHKWAQLDASGCEHTMLNLVNSPIFHKNGLRFVKVQGGKARCPLLSSIHPRKHWCGMPKWWFAEVWKLLFQRWDFGDVGTFRDDCKWWRVWLTLFVRPHDSILCAGQVSLTVVGIEDVNETHLLIQSTQASRSSVWKGSWSFEWSCCFDLLDMSLRQTPQLFTNTGSLMNLVSSAHLLLNLFVNCIW